MTERRVRVSAKALIIRDGRMLAIQMHDTDGEFYIMPGGGQEAGELLPAAVEREVLEETGHTVRVRDVAFVIEGAQGEKDHRVDIVFACDDLSTGGIVSHPDSNQVGHAWLELTSLNRAPLYPSRLRRAIMDYAQGKHEKVYLGNENVGDPEISD
ncbi:MAG: NUDIX domain-containing protein [Clostridia bacterium]|nr:NUDIX domain-containing protein [Clostridia bacterium]